MTDFNAFWVFWGVVFGADLGLRSAFWAPSWPKMARSWALIPFHLVEYRRFLNKECYLFLLRLHRVHWLQFRDEIWRPYGLFLAQDTAQKQWAIGCRITLRVYIAQKQWAIGRRITLRV